MQQKLGIGHGHSSIGYTASEIHRRRPIVPDALPSGQVAPLEAIRMRIQFERAVCKGQRNPLVSAARRAHQAHGHLERVAEIVAAAERLGAGLVRAHQALDRIGEGVGRRLFEKVGMHGGSDSASIPALYLTVAASPSSKPALR